MSIDLNKRAEKVNIVLTKRNLSKAPKMRVGFVTDVSGSAKWMYDRGIIQDTLDRLLAVALKFDDNGEMDVWSFHNNFNRLETASAADEKTYVKNEILPKASLWGGTSYAPVMNDVVTFYFKDEVVEKKTGGFLGFGGKTETTTITKTDKTTPALCLFITDGVNDDQSRTLQVLKDAVKYPVYWMMVGVGDARHFKFLEQVADDLPNVGFVNLESLDITDEQLYEEIINPELVEFIRKF